MYAVFRSGGKQYRAATGDVLRLEKIDAEEGADVSFDEVLLVGEGADVKVGSPLIEGSTVSGKVLKQGKTRKVNVVKFRRRQNYLRQGTHRQFFTEVEITAIDGKGGTVKKADGEGAAKPAKKKAAKKTASKKTAAKKDD
jgi:large subunit ribosomal protein L21